MSDRRKISHEQFIAELRAQGVPKINLAFVCPVCKTVQSAADLIRVKAGTTFEEVEKYLGFSCIGRFTKAGPHKAKDIPGKGCDWTLGGLFHFHELEVEQSGKTQMSFEIASPEQARANMAASQKQEPCLQP